jgi:hypothetical protein
MARRTGQRAHEASSARFRSAQRRQGHPPSYRPAGAPSRQRAAARSASHCERLATPCTEALLTLHAIADEACAGLFVALDRFADRAAGTRPVVASSWRGQDHWQAPPPAIAGVLPKIRADRPSPSRLVRRSRALRRCAQDDVAKVIRSVGPTIVPAGLLHRPQLPSRWGHGTPVCVGSQFGI